MAQMAQGGGPSRAAVLELAVLRPEAREQSVNE